MSTTAQQYIGYDNLITISNVAATSEQTSYPATNLANPQTKSLWKSNDAVSVQYVTVTLGGADVDYVGIAGHNFGSTGCSVIIEGQDAEGGSWATLVASFTPTTDKPILKVFTSDNLYAIRLKLTPAGVTKPETAVLYVGAVTLLERNIYVGHTPITYNRSVAAVNGMSESGAFLGRIIRGSSYRASIAIKNMTPAWYRSILDAFVLASKTVPFFYSWRYVDYPAEVGFCWIKSGVPVPENSGPNGMMSISFDVEGVA